METQLIKPIVKIGNSAGVVLPKAWLNNKVKVELIEESIEDITQKTIQILTEKNLLKETIGIYLTGSYARNEQTNDSDIDLLIITNNENDRIILGKYDLLLVSEKVLKENLKTNIMPLLPMITEAKPIINKELIEKYKKTSLTWKNLKWHIETTKSAIKMAKEDISLSKQLLEKNASSAVSYSTTLRIRGLYIINCLRENKLWDKKRLIKLIEKISGSDKAYKGYLQTKNKNSKKRLNILPMNEAERLVEYIRKENLKQEKWVKEKEKNESKGKD